MTDPILVLYVGTDSASADQLAAVVEQGYPRISVETATNTEAGRDTIDGGSIDCVVSEYTLAETDGLTFLTDIREGHPNLPCLLFTERSDEEFTREALSAGITDYVRKQPGTAQYLVLANRIEAAVDKRRAEVSRQQTRNRQEALTQAASDAIITIDEDSTVEFVNPAIEDIFGYRPDELIGQPLTALMSEAAGEQHRAGIARYLRTGEKHLDWDYLELAGRHKDGHEVPVGVSFGEFEQNGERFFTGVIRDITEQKRIRDELRRERNQNEKIVETSPVGIIINDAQGEVTFTNTRAEEILGLPEGWEEDRSYYASQFEVGDLVGNEIPDEEYPFRRVTETGEPIFDEKLSVKRPDGQRIMLSMNAVPLRTESGEVAETMFTIEDITEERRLERELGEVFGRVTDAFFALNRNWEFTYVNERAEALIDSTEDELLGETVWDAYSEAVGTTFEEEYRRAMEGQESVTFEEYFPPLERWFAVRAYPSETGLSVYFRDITDRKEREQALREEKERFQGLVQEVKDYAIFMLDTDGCIESWNQGAERIKGYEEDEILGEHISTFYTDDKIEDGLPEQLLTRAAEQGRAADEGWRVRKDGSRFWASVVITALHDGEGGLRGFAKVTRDITDRKEREEQLTSLNVMARELLEAKNSQEVSEVVIEAIRTDLKLPVAMIALYDEESGELRPAARTPDAERLLDDTPVLDAGTGIAWRAFVENEVVESQEFAAQTADTDAQAALVTGSIIPLGKHGVLITGTETTDGQSEDTVNLTKVLAANVHAALDRAERDRQLQEREAMLEDQNETLERVNRINEVIRRIDQVLVDATTREEIERAVCDELADSGPYRSAWIGEYDSVNETVTPRQWAGVERSYLESITSTADEQSTNPEPARAAAETRETHVVENTHTNPPLDPWQKEALARGYRSAISVPLTYQDSLYGVLTVYADQPSVFDELEQSVVEEFSETIAHALTALDRKRALVSDSVVEIEFRISDPTIPILQLVDETGCEFTFESVVPSPDGLLRVFFATRGASAEEVSAFAERSPALAECRLIADRGDECQFEGTVTERSFVSTLLDHGAVPRTITAEGGDGHVLVELPESADVRRFAEMFETKYPESELVARRRSERSTQTRHGFRAEFEESLTERQQEVLRTAYFSGFFESPRESTGQEIGEALDVSQPTVNYHLRASQRKLFEMLFEDERSTADSR